MPIYAYRCEDCGHSKDLLQKLSDPPVVTCPSCGKPSFRKQLTAAGFQLKGSGWYVTDFKNKSAGNATATSKSSTTESGGSSSDGAKPGSDGGTKSSDGGSGGASAAGGCGAACSCH